MARSERVSATLVDLPVLYQWRSRIDGRYTGCGEWNIMKPSATSKEFDVGCLIEFCSLKFLIRCTN